MKFGEICLKCKSPAEIHNGRGNYICSCRNRKIWAAVAENDRKDGINEDRLMPTEK